MAHKHLAKCKHHQSREKCKLKPQCNTTIHLARMPKMKKTEHIRGWQGYVTTGTLIHAEEGIKWLMPL